MTPEKSFLSMGAKIVIGVPDQIRGAGVLLDMHDEVNPAEPRPMAQRYYFDLIEDDHVVVDQDGIELTTPAQVQSEAQRCAAWIAAGYRNGHRPAVSRIRVRDASGTLYLELPVQPARSNEGKGPSGE